MARWYDILSNEARKFSVKLTNSITSEWEQDDESPVWDDIDEDPYGETGTPDTRNDHPEAFRWNCCDVSCDKIETECHTGPHIKYLNGGDDGDRSWPGRIVGTLPPLPYTLAPHLAPCIAFAPGRI
jgi:hypothetical protein